MKTISAIIPTYQHGKTIGACLQSIFAQTRQPAEVIVVNDGSTDNTLEILKPYFDKITLIDQENQGGNAARNRGLEQSTGDQVIFCDADVVMNPLMLDKLAETLELNPQASYAYSAFRFGWKSFSGFPFDAERLKKMNYIHTTSLIRREHFPGFDPEIKRLQDWDVWLTMLEQGHRGVFISKELFSVIDDHGRKGISEWRPSILYRVPWKKLGWMPQSIRKYEEAREVIRKKHRL